MASRVGESLTLPALRLPDIQGRARGGRRSALARACSAAPSLRVHDAMAGWGTDGLVLASLGCVVHMSERIAAVYAVLAARAVRFARANGGDRATLTWTLEDARQKWRQGAEFDVVYLDPMFGSHPKTALAAKPMQVLSELAAPMADEVLTAYINEARQVASSRVVVKRRTHAPAQLAPDWCVKARSVRFDVYLPYRSAGAGRSRS